MTTSRLHAVIDAYPAVGEHGQLTREQWWDSFEQVLTAENTDPKRGPVDLTLCDRLMWQLVLHEGQAVPTGAATFRRALTRAIEVGFNPLIDDPSSNRDPFDALRGTSSGRAMSLVVAQAMIERDKKGAGLLDKRGGNLLHVIAERLPYHFAGWIDYMADKAELPAAWFSASDDWGQTPLHRMWGGIGLLSRQVAGEGTAENTSQLWAGVRLLVENGNTLSQENQDGVSAGQCIGDFMRRGLPDYDGLGGAMLAQWECERLEQRTAPVGELRTRQARL